MDYVQNHQQLKVGQAFADVNYFEKRLQGLGNWWQKIALVGKINSFEVASTILADMDAARTNFDELQQRLIAQLVHEHLQNAVKHGTSRCQIAIDVLIRNLFERTADIGFLAVDDNIGHFMDLSDVDAEHYAALQSHFQQYVAKYSVYNDVVLLGINGEEKIRLSGQLSSANHRNLVEKTRRVPDLFTETLGFSELQPDQPLSLIYSQPVRSPSSGDITGILCLCFRFDDEMQGIFSALTDDDSGRMMAVTGADGRVLASSSVQTLPLFSRLPRNAGQQLFRIGYESYLLTACSGNSYQDYPGPDGLEICMLTPLSLFRRQAEGEKSVLSSQQLPAELVDIQQRSRGVNEDLELLVLNGIITAARSHSMEFLPVLESIKQIGRDINQVFSASIMSLHHTVWSSKEDEVCLLARQAADILDRNLYERANDCRWWAQNPEFRSQLGKASIDINHLTEMLAYIHSLYTVYYTLYLYDAKGNVVAVSTEQHRNFCGEPLNEKTAFASALRLESSQAYTVSGFVESEFYQQQQTYIYNAAVHAADNDKKIVGGIGVVFDSTPQFRAVLQDVLPADQAGLAMFIERSGRIIACSEDSLLIRQFHLPEHLLILAAGEAVSETIELDGQQYLMGVAAGDGYREFKRDDGYDNQLLSCILIPC